MVLIFAILARAYVYTLLFELGTSKDRSVGHMAESSSLGTESGGLAQDACPGALLSAGAGCALSVVVLLGRLRQESGHH